MQHLFLYFAYGSNMNADRMLQRCPGAIAVGPAVLNNYKLTERLYADIDFAERHHVNGVLYLITEAHMRALDRFEGYPRTYRRMWLEVQHDQGKYLALTYEMTEATKADREGQPYPEEYRELCAAGARYHGVRNHFTKRRKTE